MPQIRGFSCDFSPRTYPIMTVLGAVAKHHPMLTGDDKPVLWRVWFTMALTSIDILFIIGVPSYCDQFYINLCKILSTSECPYSIIPLSRPLSCKLGEFHSFDHIHHNSTRFWSYEPPFAIVWNDFSEVLKHHIS